MYSCSQCMRGANVTLMYYVLLIIEPSVCDTRSVLIVMFRIIKMVDVNFYGN